jgi:peptidyl-prolyl cis-trans isomerase B (cyclophilin B)
VVSKDQRRRQLAREKFERQQERRASARDRVRRRNAVIASVVAFVVVVGGIAWAVTAFTGGGKKKAASAATTPSASASASPSKAPDPCAKPAAGTVGKKQWKKEPAVTIDTKATYQFTLKTTCGTIPITMDAAKAPHTVNSFDFLAGQGYFDHSKCHRLVTAGIYVLQCGDPTGTGSGGPGYTIPDENLKSLGKPVKSGTYKGTVTYKRGTVAMANTGKAHTGGSQFFLVYKDSPLGPNYTPFGTVTKAGMKVLDKIAKAGTSGEQGDGPPNATVVINKAVVTKD